MRLWETKKQMEDHLPNFAKEVNRLLVMLTYNTYQGNGTKAGLTVDSFIIAYAEGFVNMHMKIIFRARGKNMCLSERPFLVT